MFEEGEDMDDGCVHTLVSGTVELRMRRADQSRFQYHTLRECARCAGCRAAA